MTRRPLIDEARLQWRMFLEDMTTISSWLDAFLTLTWSYIQWAVMAHFAGFGVGVLVMAFDRMQGVPWVTDAALCYLLTISVLMCVTVVNMLRPPAPPPPPPPAPTRLPDLAVVPTMNRVYVPQHRPHHFEMIVDTPDLWGRWASICSTDKLPSLIRQLAALPQGDAASTRKIKGLSRREVRKLTSFLVGRGFADLSRGAAVLNSKGRAEVANLLPHR